MADTILCSACSLDDLPGEVVALVWKQCFLGLRVVLHSNTQDEGSIDSALDPLWLINKKLSAIAKSQMLECATIVLKNELQVASLLCGCEDLLRVHSIEILHDQTGFRGHVRYNFSLLDDLFRALHNLNHVSLILDCRLADLEEWTNIAFDESDDAEEFYMAAILAKRKRAKRLLRLATENPDRLGGLEDIMEGKAFTGRKHVPDVRLYLRPSMDGFSPCPSNTLLPTLQYCWKTHTLQGTVGGRHYELHQQALHLQADRYGGRQLHDKSSVEANHSILKILESVLERTLTPFVRIRLARYQDWQLESTTLRPPWSCCRVSNKHITWYHNQTEEDIRNLGICHALLWMYNFDYSIEPCNKVVRWLESHMTPALMLSSLSEAQNLLSRAPGCREGSMLLLEQTWKLRDRSGPVESLVELCMLLMPALIPIVAKVRNAIMSNTKSCLIEEPYGKTSVWWQYFQVLYFSGPDGRWKTGDDWNEGCV